MFWINKGPLKSHVLGVLTFISNAAIVTTLTDDSKYELLYHMEWYVMLQKFELTPSLPHDVSLDSWTYFKCVYQKYYNKNPYIALARTISITEPTSMGQNKAYYIILQFWRRIHHNCNCLSHPIPFLFFALCTKQGQLLSLVKPPFPVNT